MPTNLDDRRARLKRAPAVRTNPKRLTRPRRRRGPPNPADRYLTRTRHGRWRVRVPLDASARQFVELRPQPGRLFLERAAAAYARDRFLSRLGVPGASGRAVHRALAASVRAA